MIKHFKVKTYIESSLKFHLWLVDHALLVFALLILVFASDTACCWYALPFFAGRHLSLLHREKGFLLLLWDISRDEFSAAFNSENGPAAWLLLFPKLLPQQQLNTKRKG